MVLHSSRSHGIKLVTSLFLTSSFVNLNPNVSWCNRVVRESIASSSFSYSSSSESLTLLLCVLPGPVVLLRDFSAGAFWILQVLLLCYFWEPCCSRRSLRRMFGSCIGGGVGGGVGGRLGGYSFWAVARVRPHPHLPFDFPLRFLGAGQP